MRQLGVTDDGAGTQKRDAYGRPNDVALRRFSDVRSRALAVLLVLFCGLFTQGVVVLLM